MNSALVAANIIWQKVTLKMENNAGTSSALTTTINFLRASNVFIVCTAVAAREPSQGLSPIALSAVHTYSKKTARPANGLNMTMSASKS